MREPQILNWAGGEHPFLLARIGELLALEKACGASVGAIFARLGSSLSGGTEWFVHDVTETLRLGLIGGGMDRDEASRIVTQTAERVGLLRLAPIAMTVLLISLRGDDDDEPEEEPKKKETPQD